MKNIIDGLFKLYCFPATILMSYWFILLEKDKQIDINKAEKNFHCKKSKKSCSNKRG